ncbi:MAG: hypothetical protein V4671_12840 [Armatimonadota bacterium]
MSTYVIAPELTAWRTGEEIWTVKGTIIYQTDQDQPTTRPLLVTWETKQRWDEIRKDWTITRVTIDEVTNEAKQFSR